MEKNDNYIIFFAIAGFVLLILIIIILSFKAILSREVSSPVNTVQTNSTIVENTVEPTVVEEENNDFEMSFLKLENKKENIVYSPLSIKTALKMLEEALPAIETFAPCVCIGKKPSFFKRTKPSSAN